jgi:UDP-N-acetylmuramate dehydrogenase
MKPVTLRHDVDLARLSTFRLSARAREMITVDHPRQLEELPPGDLPLLVLGGGSNTVFLGDWPGRILLNRLGGIRIERIDEYFSRVEVAAGENWHQLVRTCIDRGLHGLENLIMIPGSVGAAPMQNIGAYGVELSNVLESVQAWDWRQQRMIELSRDECDLGYRDSRFKSADRGRFLITGIRMRLAHEFRPDTRYEGLARALSHRHLDKPSPRQLTAAVMRLRRHRLPDPDRLPNAGSFFKNPVVQATEARELLKDFTALPHWTLPNGQVKLAAGWMIERLGFRGYRIGDAGVYRNHALVLVNHGQATTAQLKELVDRIHSAVDSEFGIELEPEPLLITPGSTG